MFDVNISYGNWPFQNFSEYTPDYLIAHLEKHGITGGLISSIDAVFQDDLDFHNRDLISRFQFAAPNFIPVMTVNPRFSNMMEMVEELSPSVLRLIPNYHTFALDDAELDALTTWCEDNNATIIIQRRILDERSHHPCCKVPGVPLEEISEFAIRHPQLKILCLNLYFHEIEKLDDNAENIHIDISSTETLNTVEGILKLIDPERVFLGTNTPFFYTKAAIMKIDGAAISQSAKKLIAGENARRFLSA